ncbi:hypothetical protein ACN28E_08070 [Archangium lansingense]|uniref:hypothetical protein n=1 Tax=Archangium lansingense TaxID=2995310 RepID=UPI003B809DA6
MSKDSYRHIASYESSDTSADTSAAAGVRSRVEHLGLPTQALKRAPARGQPQQAWC